MLHLTNPDGIIEPVAYKAILFTLRNEDDTWDTRAKLEDLDDGAGLTFIGITEKYDGYYLKQEHDIDVVGLSQLYHIEKTKAINIIIDIYHQKYWRGFDKINDERIAIRLFDLAVNCGFGGLENILSRAGFSHKFNPAEINNMITDVNGAKTLEVIKKAALERYKSLKGWKQFGRGWSNRLLKSEYVI